MTGLRNWVKGERDSPSQQQEERRLRQIAA